MLGAGRGYEPADTALTGGGPRVKMSLNLLDKTTGPSTKASNGISLPQWEGFLLVSLIMVEPDIKTNPINYQVEMNRLEQKWKKEQMDKKEPYHCKDILSEK